MAVCLQRFNDLLKWLSNKKCQLYFKKSVNFCKIADSVGTGFQQRQNKNKNKTKRVISLVKDES